MNPNSVISFVLFIWMPTIITQDKMIGTDTSTKPDKIGCNAAVIVHGSDICFARNLDITFDNGFWIINQRNIRKTSYIPGDTEENPATWTSKYGSLTINGFHADMPLGGINEKGLVVEHLACDGTKYPVKDNRAAATPFQWMQYQLDNFSTVAEVINSEADVRITGWIFEIMHYLICDAKGNMAIIEYIGNDKGESGRRIYTGNSIPEYMTALGNATYKEHIKFMGKFKNFGGTQLIPTDRDNLASDTRYQFAYSVEKVRQFQEKPNHNMVDYSFDILKTYTWDCTHLSIVYDIANLTLYFITSHNKNRRAIALSDLDFSHSAPRKGLFRHGEPKPENWNTDFDWINSCSIDYFDKFGKFDRFKLYRNELKIYCDIMNFHVFVFKNGQLKIQDILSHYRD